MNRLRLFFLAIKETILLNQIENQTGLLRDHEIRVTNLLAEQHMALDKLNTELRKTRSEIVRRAPPADLHVAIKAWRLRG